MIPSSSAGELHKVLLHKLSPLKPTVLFEYLFLNLGEFSEIDRLQAQCENLVISVFRGRISEKPFHKQYYESLGCSSM